MVLLFSGMCMVSSGLSFLFLNVSNMSYKCGNKARSIGVASDHKCPIINGIMVLLSQLLGLMVTLPKPIGNPNLTSGSVFSLLVYQGLTIQ